MDLQLQPARPADRPRTAATSPRVACQGGIPWSDAFGPNLTNNINLIFFLAFLLFSWTTASIMSGALLERVRLSAYLVLAVLLGSVVWILDAAWGWSAGGWLTLRFGFHDSIASGVVHGVAGAFTLGVLFNLGPRIGKYTKEGLARQFRPHNLHITLMGLMLIFTGFYAFYAACLVIVVDHLPGLGEHLPQPDDARLDHDGDHDRASRAASPAATSPAGVTRSGRSRAASPGVIGVSAGADVYAPTLAYLLAMVTAVLVVYAGNWIEKKMRVDDAVGAVAVHGVAGFLGRALGRHLRRRLPDRPQQRRELDRRPADRAWRPSCRSASCRAGSRRWSCKKLNLLRVPPEVELDGLDVAEYEPDIHMPEYGPGRGPDDRARRHPGRRPRGFRPRRRGSWSDDGRPSDDARGRGSHAGDNRQRARLRRPARPDRGRRATTPPTSSSADQLRGLRRVHDLRPRLDLR